jgi:excisionase family DNA binding protein
MPILYSMQEAAEALGGISHWTLRKHASSGRIKVVRLGRRVFVDTEELERVRREGLPSLRTDAGGDITPTSNLNSQQENEQSCLNNQTR